MPRPRIADLQQTIKELEYRCGKVENEKDEVKAQYEALQPEVSTLANELRAYRFRAHRAEEQVVKLLCALEGKK